MGFKKRRWVSRGHSEGGSLFQLMDKVIFFTMSMSIPFYNASCLVMCTPNHA